MSKKLAEIYGRMAEALEAAGAAARELETGYDKSGGDEASGADDGVAGGGAGSKGKAVAAAKKVAGKPAKSGKAKPPAITFEDLKTKLTELMDLKGKEVVKTLMSEFGAAKLVEIEEDSYADVMAKIDEAMVADEEEVTTDDDDMFGP